MAREVSCRLLFTAIRDECNRLTESSLKSYSTLMSQVLTSSREDSQRGIYIYIYALCQKYPASQLHTCSSLEQFWVKLCAQEQEPTQLSECALATYQSLLDVSARFLNSASLGSKVQYVRIAHLSKKQLGSSILQE